MHFLAHLSYPYVLANGAALALGKTIPWQYNIILILFSLFPDIDVVFDFVKQMFSSKKYKVPLVHHQNPTHWPIVYVPLLVLALITLEPFLLMAAGAIYLHLFMDTFFCNQGVMWFYPFKRKWFNFFARETRRKLGWAWNDAYRKLGIYNIDKFAFSLLVIHVSILAFF